MAQYFATGSLGARGMYFANSFGAAVGVLVAGFVLFKAVGLPGTLQAAGIRTE